MGIGAALAWWHWLEDGFKLSFNALHPLCQRVNPLIKTFDFSKYLIKTGVHLPAKLLNQFFSRALI